MDQFRGVDERHAIRPTAKNFDYDFLVLRKFLNKTIPEMVLKLNPEQKETGGGRAQFKWCHIW